MNLIQKNIAKGCLQNKKRVNFRTLAQKGGGGNGKIPNGKAQLQFQLQIG